MGMNARGDATHHSLRWVHLAQFFELRIDQLQDAVDLVVKQSLELLAAWMLVGVECMR